MTSTAPAAAVWAGRSDSGWAEQYWTHTFQRHRGVLLRALRSIEGATSFLEIGCAAGVNLRLLRATQPTAALLGVDVNPHLLTIAFERLPMGAGVELLQADISTLDTLPPVDVAFSCYCLAYVHPDDIARVVGTMLAAARRAVVLMEPMVTEAERLTSRIVYPAKGETPREWAHPYHRMLPTSVQTATWQIDPPVDRLNRCVIARKDRRK